MKRERIAISDEELKLIIVFDQENDSDLYEFMEEEVTETGYKNSTSYEMVIKRLSDGKFFIGDYTVWHAAGEVNTPGDFTEVFPKTKTIIKTTYH